MKDPAVLSSRDDRLPAALRDLLATAPGGEITLTSHRVEPAGSVLTLSGTSTDRWPVQGLKDVEIALHEVTITITDGATPAVTVALTGLLPLNASVRAPVTVVPGDRPGEWRIALTGDAGGVSPTDLLLLGRPGRVSPFPVPPGLEALTAGATVPATGFDIRFYPGTTHEALVDFTVPLPAVRWKIIPSVLEADGIEISGTLSTHSVAMTVVGHFRIDDVAMDIGVGLQPGTHWYAFARPTGWDDPVEGTKVHFPGIAALAGWIARSDGSEPAPTSSAFGSAGLNASAFDLAIEAVEVGFDWGAPAFDYLRITSLLTLGGLDLDVVLVLPQSELSGSLHGDEPVPLAGVLSGFGLDASGVPPLKITEVRFAAQPRTGFYMLELGVDDLWSAGPVQISAVDMVVAYSAGDGVTGTVHGAIDIGSSIHLFVLARYAGSRDGWEFKGGTAPGSELDIRDLTTKLTRDFGLGVPEAISSLSLRDLSVSYRTGSGAFVFTAEGDMTITEVAVRLGVAIAPKGPGEIFTGWLDVAVPAEGKKAIDLRFDARFSKDTTAGRFAATYSRQGDAAMPDVKSLVRAFSPTAAEPIPGGITIDVRDVVFAVDQGAAGKGYLFGVDIAATIDFAKLPLVGDHFAGPAPAGVDPLRIIASSAQIGADEVKALNLLLPDKVGKLPERDIAKGFAVDAVLKLGTAALPVAVTVGGAQKGPPPAKALAAGQPPATAPQSQTGDDVTWLKVQRSFGPIKIERLGLAYRDGRLAFLLDASISLAGLTLALQGLAVELALSAKPDPRFDLKGLGLSYSSGPVQISGAFLKGEIAYEGKKYPAYGGTAQIKTSTLGLGAIGSYVQLPEGPSLFVYAILDYPIGGPPVFFVRGLAAGFGYNRRLVPPPVDKIAEFPLVAEAVGRREGDLDLAAELARLADYLPPSIGDYFLAVGVHFTSFQMIDSFVLLAVQFGHRFEVDVLGLSTLVLPAPDAQAGGVTPIAEVQLALRASFVPEDGYLIVEAQLTKNSFLLSRDCHLTGGFAFATWFGAAHHGDFVVSVGGYHPHVAVPKHYPAVPRLGFSWQVSKQLSLSGGAYFALTPSALMAGGSLKATWKDDSLHAWFDAAMDFLIAWQPYHYTAAAHVNVGASYSFTSDGNNPISVHASADVRLWGPDFGGTAAIDLGIVSITVTFPENAREAAEPEPVEWSRFSAAMLPEPGKIVTIALQGDTRQGGAAPNDPDDPDLGIADAAGLVLRTDSVVPSTAGTRGATPAPLPTDGTTTAFGVGPVGIGKGEAAVTQHIEITQGGEQVDDRFGYAPVGKNLPVALWGDRLVPSATGPQLIDGMLAGYTIRPLPPTSPARRPWLPRAALQASTPYSESRVIRLDAPPPVAVSGDDAARRRAAITAVLADPGTAAARSAAVAAVLPGAEIDLAGFDLAHFHETPQVAHD
ncbi:DUF6603 domain-containing protein [Actinomadura bangladeshensis]|uniref:DUF6603 domain-containing protein n=1 Tax=Actinomadura bangladeshensis TaxID=453573 RepID=A0A4R4PBD8_9ACTN|nr:DUF6603 domain-containing protein [Actinomadura bangladeshensis]TDC19264.1 hypothetical protein E1284_04080 [Actinomadura bangladeshensis]